jgi:hypothetical protein
MDQIQTTRMPFNNSENHGGRQTQCVLMAGCPIFGIAFPFFLSVVLINVK